jgi:hypothetical protein
MEKPEMVALFARVLPAGSRKYQSPVAEHNSIPVKDEQPRWSVPECVRLTDEYMRRKEDFATAVDRFFAIGYRVADAEYRKLKTSTETARIHLEAAASRLEKHRQVHPMRGDAGTGTR